MGRVRVRAQNNYYYVAFQSVERNVCALTPEMQKTLSILRIPVKSATLRKDQSCLRTSITSIYK